MPKFEVTGSMVKLYKYSVDCRDLDVEIFPVTAVGAVKPEVMYFVDKDSADIIAAAVNRQVVEIDTAAYEWLSTITIPNTDDPIAAVINAYKMGEAAYKAQYALAEKSKNEQLRADLDYVMLMGGL